MENTEIDGMADVHNARAQKHDGTATTDSKDRGQEDELNRPHDSAATPPTKVNSSRLLQLPPEVRLMIWRNLLEVARILKIHAGSSPFDWAELLESMLDRSQNRLAWSLLRLSAELKGEMAEILYGTNTLEFCGPGGWKKLHAFLLQIGPTNQAYLRELVLPIPVEGFLICWGWVFGEADPSDEAEATSNGDVASECARLLVQAGGLRKLTLRSRVWEIEIGTFTNIAWRCLNALKDGLTNLEVFMVSEPEEEDEEDEDVIPGQEAATFEWKVIKEEEIRPIKG